METTLDFDEMDLGRRKCFMQNEDPFRNDPNKYFQVRENSLAAPKRKISNGMLRHSFGPLGESKKL